MANAYLMDPANRRRLRFEDDAAAGRTLAWPEGTPDAVVAALRTRSASAGRALRADEADDYDGGADDYAGDELDDEVGQEDDAADSGGEKKASKKQKQEVDAGASSTNSASELVCRPLPLALQLWQPLVYVPVSRAILATQQNSPVL